MFSDSGIQVTHSTVRLSGGVLCWTSGRATTPSGRVYRPSMDGKREGPAGQQKPEWYAQEVRRSQECNTSRGWKSDQANHVNDPNTHTLVKYIFSFQSIDPNEQLLPDMHSIGAIQLCQIR